MSRQPINLISDTESESESDGGMQLDDLDRVDGIPMFGSEGDGLNVDGIPMSRPGRDDDDWDVNGDMSNESDTSMYSPRLVSTPTFHHLILASVHNYTAPILPQYRTHPTQPQRNLQTNTPKRKIH
jgi:hypothetical protein